MSSKVARALKLLGKDVNQVDRGAKDPQLVDQALRESRYVFTANHDLVVIAGEKRCGVIYNASGGKSLTMFDTAKLFFRKWAKYEELLTPPDADALRITRTTQRVVTFDEVRDEARKREERRRRAEEDNARRRSQRRQRAEKPSPGALRLQFGED